jgi:hypothetical protein
MQVRMSGKAASCAARVRPAGPQPDDEHVDLGRRGIRVRRRQGGRVGEVGVAGLEAIQVELHVCSVARGRGPPEPASYDKILIIQEVAARFRGASPGFSYFAVGITNSAPLPMLSGQRCMIDFCLV